MLQFSTLCGAAVKQNNNVTIVQFYQRLDSDEEEILPSQTAEESLLVSSGPNNNLRKTLTLEFSETGFS